jgi:uncharacterized protein YggE
MQTLGFQHFLVAALLAALSLSPAGAAEAPASPTVSVEAEGKVLAKPDMATLNLDVETQAANAEAASTENASRAQGLLASLKKVLGPEDKVRTLSFRVLPLRVRRDKSHPLEIKGYQALHRFQVQVKDLDRLGRVLDTALASGAAQINGPYWGHSRLEELQREAAVDAFNRARRLAEVLAQAAGLKIKEVEKISTGVRFIPLRAAAEGYLAARAPGPTPMEVGEEEIKANVQVVFRLTP